MLLFEHNIDLQGYKAQAI